MGNKDQDFSKLACLAVQSKKIKGCVLAADGKKLINLSDLDTDAVR